MCVHAQEMYAHAFVKEICTCIYKLVEEKPRQDVMHAVVEKQSAFMYACMWNTYTLLRDIEWKRMLA